MSSTRLQQQSFSSELKLEDEQSVSIALEFELKLLQMYGPALSIYAMPSLNNVYVWSGLIFVRHGYYKDGRFAFQLNMAGFPSTRPKITFTNRLFHPLVEQCSGECDVASLLSEPWNYGNQNMVYSLMSDMAKMFNDRLRLINRFSYNPTAAQLYEENTHEFISRAMKCVSESTEAEQDEQSCFRTNQEWNAEIEEIKAQLGESIAKEGSLMEKVEDFVCRVLE